MYICRERFIFNQLAHMIMKPGKSKTCRVGWLERSVLQSGLQVACRQNSFLVWKGQPSVLLRPSNDWMSPTRIMKSSLLYLMSTVIYFFWLHLLRWPGQQNYTGFRYTTTQHAICTECSPPQLKSSSITLCPPPSPPPPGHHHTAEPSLLIPL